MFEEVGIDFVGDAAIGFMRRPHALGWASPHPTDEPANVNSLVTATVPPVSVSLRNTLSRNTARSHTRAGRFVNSPCHETFGECFAAVLANRVGTRSASFAPKTPVFSLFGRFLSDPSGRAPKSPHARRRLVARCYKTALSGHICGLSPTVPPIASVLKRPVDSPTM